MYRSLRAAREAADAWPPEDIGPSVPGALTRGRTAPATRQVGEQQSARDAAAIIVVNPVRVKPSQRGDFDRMKQTATGEREWEGNQ